MPPTTVTTTPSEAPAWLALRWRLLGGIPIGGGQFIPLGLDPLLDLSLGVGGSLGLVGITDANGVGTPTLQIPNLTALVGVSFHAAGVTAGSGGSIGNISNNHYIKIVP